MDINSTVRVESHQTSKVSLSRYWEKFGMLTVFAVLFLACCFLVPNFASFINMKGLGLAISMSGMIACAMLFCLACGDLDLSVASVVACSGVVTAVVINMTESVFVGVGAGLLSGLFLRFSEWFRYCKAEDQCLDYHPGDHADCPWCRLYHF